MKKTIPIEISARHIHLSQKHVEMLFGVGAELHSAKIISQPNQFVAKERVEIQGPKKSFKEVAIVGPTRQETQIEISLTDAHALGIPQTPIIVSGSHTQSSGGVTLCGPAGKINLQSGVMIAERHVHASAKQAKQLGLSHGDRINVTLKSKRPLTLHNVVVRSREGIDELALHLDTDEANAAGVTMNDLAELA